jgi:tripartite-type tricarboxylate transporter receptor subunit TctC
LGVPARTPREVVERLNREVVAALNHAPTRQKLIEMNIEPSPGTPSQGQDWLASETRHWGEVIQRAGIQKQ